jgi:hypothetical protein
MPPANIATIKIKPILPYHGFMVLDDSSRIDEDLPERSGKSIYD